MRISKRLMGLGGNGVDTKSNEWGCRPRESVNALIGQFAGSEVDYPLYGPAFALAAEGAEQR